MLAVTPKPELGENCMHFISTVLGIDKLIYCIQCQLNTNHIQGLYGQYMTGNDSHAVPTHLWVFIHC